MLCQGSELYGVGTIQKLYAQGAPGLLFVCFEEGPLWTWLGERGYRRLLVDGFARFTAGRSSLNFLTRLPGALHRAATTASNLAPTLRREGIRIVHTHWSLVARSGA